MAAPKKRPQGGTNRATGPQRKKNPAVYFNTWPVAAGDKEGTRAAQDELNRRKKKPGYSAPSPRRGTGGRR